jgi:CubicO group peptidase (beta-lactamase class C family)
MKKLLGIMVLGLLLSGNAYANINSFNKWLYDNGHYELVEKVESEKCKSFDKGDTNWYYNNCDRPLYKNKSEIYTYPSRYWIPEENPKPKPNYITLAYEFFRYSIFEKPKVMKYSINPSKTSYKFQSNLIEEKYIDKQLNKSGLLSYLFFENGEIKIDKISPKNRFGKFIDDDTKFRSQSVGKTMVSYVVGHAICEGYIESVDSKVNDWPILENTLYYNQKLINLLNFRAGDQKYTWDYFFVNPKIFKNNEGKTIETYLNFEFQNSKKSKAKFNYSSFLANLILNYVVFKTDENFEELLEKIFKEKVKIENEVFFSKVLGPKLQGNADNIFYATRYDYLRIAKAMLDDWQNDTCVGKYLKTIFEKKEKKGNQRKPANFPYARSYAGMFQTNYEFIPKKRPVMGMHGYGGQHIVIDFENSRIIVANSIHENWDAKKIIYSKIRKGIN